MTLEQLYQYIPYNVRVIEGNSEFALSGSLLDDWINYPMLHDYKVKLRSLSDLENQIEVNGETIVPIEWLEDKYYTLDLHKQCERIIEDERWINQCDHLLIIHLVEWHFDIAGLIESGLAIEIEHPSTPK